MRFVSNSLPCRSNQTWTVTWPLTDGADGEVVGLELGDGRVDGDEGGLGAVGDADGRAGPLGAGPSEAAPWPTHAVPARATATTNIMSRFIPLLLRTIGRWDRRKREQRRLRWKVTVPIPHPVGSER